MNRQTVGNRRKLNAEQLETRCYLTKFADLDVSFDDDDRSAERNPTIEYVNSISLHGASDGFRTGYLPPKHTIIASKGNFLTRKSTRSPLDIAVSYLRDHVSELGLEKRDLNFRVSDQYESQHTNTTHIYLQQTLHGLDVANAYININITEDGQVANAESRFLPGISTEKFKKRQLRPWISPQWACEYFVSGFLNVDNSRTQKDSDDSNQSCQTRTAAGQGKLEYVPVVGGGVEMAWAFDVRTSDGANWYGVRVSAVDGNVLNVVDWVSDASYEVFPLPLENPLEGPRSLVIDPSDQLASPAGWHDIGGIVNFRDTRGNNAYVQEDHDGDNLLGHRPEGGDELQFAFSANLNGDTHFYADASITNLFYLTNLLHDIHYRYGFDEAAGNFQQFNFDRGGLGEDAVLVDAQEGSSINRANFATPPDGIAGRMQLSLFDKTNPKRDSGFDNGIVIHEYGHGVSTRLTGGPANAASLATLQSGGMGEGWSDWWTLMLTQKAADSKFAASPIGTYVLGQSESGPGLRQYPYSYDMEINPLTYDHVNRAPRIHRIGEVWAAVLWDLNWRLIDRYGFTPNVPSGYSPKSEVGAGGNHLALQLVMDGLKLQPANPTFLDGRNAILLADEILTGGQHQNEIWNAFARRGIGYSANDGSGDAPIAFSNSISFSPDGRHIYIGSYYDGSIAAFEQDPNTGEVSYVQAIIDNGEMGLERVESVTVSPDGKHLYSASVADDSVGIFARDSSTGFLTYVDTATDGEAGIDGLDGARSITVSPDGNYVYVAGYRDDALAVLRRDQDTGNLTSFQSIQADDENLNGLENVIFVTVSPDGRNVYVTSRDVDTVSVWQRDTGTGMLEHRQTIQDDLAGVDGLRGARSMVVSPDGTNVYVAGFYDDAVATFVRDTNTGHLKFQQVLKNGVDGVTGLDAIRSIAISTDGMNVYTASFYDESVGVFDRDQDTGSLTFRKNVTQSRRPNVLDELAAIAVSPRTDFVLTTSLADISSSPGRPNLGGNALTVFKRNPTTRNLGYHSAVTGRGPNFVEEAFDLPPNLRVVGDVNYDGVFDSIDLIQVNRLGEYEDDRLYNSTWVEGDWNGDGEFSSADLVLAFQTGSYCQGGKATTLDLATQIDSIFFSNDESNDENKQDANWIFLGIRQMSRVPFAIDD